MSTITYDGERIDAETGEETPFYGASADQIIRWLRKLKDGDALVINAKRESSL